MEAARTLGLQIHVLNASTSREIEAAFAVLARDRADAVFVAADVFFTSRRVQFATLATRYGIPAAYGNRDIVEAGGLMSYGTDVSDTCRQVGVYAGRILKGENLPTFRHSRRLTLSWPSISGRPRRSASPCRRRCSPSPTR
jgi:putative ABC transport system substrate-binding protein